MFRRLDKPFDIFLSYKSEDSIWVKSLKNALARRGVRVWLDKDQIRPGDHFAEALETGLQMSSSVGLIVTPASMRSNWIREEYYRALSLANEDELQLIPILLEQAPVPPFLKGRQHVDFTNPESYDQSVDRLIWPGITGRRIVTVWLRPSDRQLGHGTHWFHGDRLHALVQKHGVEMIEVGLDDDSWWQQGCSRGSLEYPVRHVVFVNIYEDAQDPAERVWRRPPGRRLASPMDYVEFVFRTREVTRGSEDELAFVLYHKSRTLAAKSGISETTLNRLQHYFTLHHDENEDQLQADLWRVWHDVQRLLLKTETRLTQPASVMLRDHNVYAVFPDTKQIQKMTAEFAANCFVNPSEVSAGFEGGNLMIRFPGKSTLAPRSVLGRPFFQVSAADEGILFVPTGHNNVHFDPHCTINVETTFPNQTRFSSVINMHLEFQRSNC